MVFGWEGKEKRDPLGGSAAAETCNGLNNSKLKSECLIRIDEKVTLGRTQRAST